VRDDQTVITLVHRANSGDSTAWDELVGRYAPLVWSICRRYRLDRPDIDDVAQGVWLRLIERLPSLRDPAALPGWLATTTQRECLRVLRIGQRREAHERPLPVETVAGGQSTMVEQELLAAERDAALREAFAALPERCRRLLGLLIADPPVPYAEISATLGVPVGSIGPNRARCLDVLRRSPTLAALIGAGASSPQGGRRDDQPVER
jgi:RNA polymerase sigma factor (sigma-70 family)